MDTEKAMETNTNSSKYIINFKKLRDIIRNPSITTMEKSLCIDLLMYAGVDGIAFPSEETLGRDMGCSERHIRTQLVKMRQKGLVLGWKKRGFSKSNQYALNPELYFRNGDTIRKSSSSHIGTTIPVQSGTTVPPNESQERNSISSSHIQQLFEETFNRKLNTTEVGQLHKLCVAYPEDWVEDSIKEASKRKTVFMKVGYLALILGDWEKDGKPPSKPIFSPCGLNGCSNGYIDGPPGSNSIIVCTCRQDFDEELSKWKEKWGGNNR